MSVWMVLFAVMVLLLILMLWKIPRWQVLAQGQDVPKEKRPELENEFRKTLAQIIGGIVVLAGVYFAWQEVVATKEGQITERFTRAIAQLGGEKPQVQLGGIYALERIAKDSPKDHWTVVEVLTAFVREEAPWREEAPCKDTEIGDPPEEIQAALTVIARRDLKQIKRERSENQVLDLRETDLRKSYLVEAQFERAHLTGAHLEKANLRRAHLQGALLLKARLDEADLSKADLRGADLLGAHLVGALLEATNLVRARLQGVDLTEANLTEANLQDVNLREAKLEEASLEEANLRGADLRLAEGLTQEQINSAYTDENTRLPSYLRKRADER